MFYSFSWLWYASLIEVYFCCFCYFVRCLSILIFIPFVVFFSSLFSCSFLSVFKSLSYICSRVVPALGGTTQSGVGAFRWGGGTALDGSVCAGIGRDQTKPWPRVDSRIREQQTATTAGGRFSTTTPQVLGEPRKICIQT